MSRQECVGGYVPGFLVDKTGDKHDCANRHWEGCGNRKGCRIMVNVHCSWCALHPVSVLCWLHDQEGVFALDPHHRRCHGYASSIRRRNAQIQRWTEERSEEHTSELQSR